MQVPNSVAINLVIRYSMCDVHIMIYMDIKTLILSYNDICTDLQMLSWYQYSAIKYEW